jgi:GT2 family glycosyltransferase
VPGPRFSIITPVYETPAIVLEATLRSVVSQTCADWELCLVDDGSRSLHVERILKRAAAKEPRIRTLRRPANGGIVAASNDALGMATGEFVALLDHDDQLHPDALRLVSDAIDADPTADYIYTDEDKLDLAGRRSLPFFKPDWSPERFRTQMYTCHLSVLRRSLVDEVGGFSPEYEGSQDWDLALKVTELARAVVHVPEVLYHWRTAATSTAGEGEAAKPYAYEAGQRALEAHCRRTGLAATVTQDAHLSGVYHLHPALPNQPPVSIVIPTGGSKRDIRGEPVVMATHCVRSVVTTSTYTDFEIVCVVDAHTDDAVLGELHELAGSRLTLVPFDRAFSFSEKINLGVLASEGEHVLMLNDDVEVVTPDWLERLVMYSREDAIGAVGARLLYGDGRLQHVGIGISQASPGHLYHGFSAEWDGFSNEVRVANNYLAVTGACLMTRRKVFDEVGGLSPLFPLSYNDVDYCLKLRTQGLRVVYDPDTVLYHFESSSRSPDVSDWELELLQDRWRAEAWVDPYSNPNFDQHSIHRVPPVYLADGSRL